MRDIWVISDTHFGHEGILKFKDDKDNVVRDFTCVADMDELMIQNWNKVVKQGDLIYHLGDVFFGPKENFQKMWPRLKGSKRLIVGNHDDIKYLSSGGFFQKVMMWRCWKEFNMIMSHVPIHMSEERSSYNVHGHIHQNNSPTKDHYNVCVEKQNYCPIHIEDLAERMKK